MLGETISHYRVLEKLARGGMGTVYKARDLKLGRFVALKFISPERLSDPAQRSRFLREAKTASALDHVNICTVYEFGETNDGGMFIAMAYCAGESLRARLDRGHLPLSTAINVATQILEGLAKAHSAGVIHRDIKPSNIMLTDDAHVKIVDFGLAKLTQEMSTTHTGAVLGTIPYMSPEQLEGKKLDHRTDIWSWGVMTYEMLIGRRPFCGESDFSTVDAILNQEPQSLTELRPDVPVELESVVLLALRKTLYERHQSAGEVVRALRLLPPCFDTEIEKFGPHSPSVVVLPFTNLSTEPESEYFSDGLTEELIHALSSIPNLHVVSRTSAFEFKDKPQNIRKIGQQLKVSTVVEGSVHRMGQQLRIHVQIVNANDGYCMWSQRFDREVKDVFEIQDDIAKAIVTMLEVKFNRDTAETSVKRPGKLEAYDLYLRGRFQWNKRDGNGLYKALEYFQQALACDPRYAPAYSGIADVQIAIASWALEAPAEAWLKAKAAAVHALELDNTLSEAHASMGTVLMWFEWNWKEAEREFLQAIKLNPGHPNAHVQYSILLVQTGRFDEAEHEIRLALLSDPLSIRASSYLAGVFHYRRDYDSSLEQSRRALDLDPNDVELHIVQALNYEQKAMYEEAIRELEKARDLAGNNPLILGPLGSCYGASRRRAKAMKLIKDLDQTAHLTYVSPITWAMVYLGLGEHDLALQWLEKAAAAKDVLVCYLRVGPIYDSIRDDPRYLKLLEQIGLTPSAESQTQTA
jgi:serine/threonine-protein kinase